MELEGPVPGPRVTKVFRVLLGLRATKVFRVLLALLESVVPPVRMQSPQLDSITKDEAAKTYGGKADVGDTPTGITHSRTVLVYYSPLPITGLITTRTESLGSSPSGHRHLSSATTLLVILNRNSGDWEAQEVDFLQKQWRTCSGCRGEEGLVLHRDPVRSSNPP